MEPRLGKCDGVSCDRRSRGRRTRFEPHDYRHRRPPLLLHPGRQEGTRPYPRHRSSREGFLSVVGSSSLRQLPGRWQFQRVLPGRQLVADLADKKKRFIFSRYTTTLLSSPRIFGNLAGCQQGPRPQAAQPDRELSVLSPRITVRFLSGSRQSL